MNVSYKETERETMAKHWMKGAVKHPGALHEDLGVPKGQKIPEKKIEAAAKRPGIVGKRARLAETFHKARLGQYS